MEKCNDQGHSRSGVKGEVNDSVGHEQGKGTSMSEGV